MKVRVLLMLCGCQLVLMGNKKKKPPREPAVFSAWMEIWSWSSHLIASMSYCRNTTTDRWPSSVKKSSHFFFFSLGEKIVLAGGISHVSSSRLTKSGGGGRGRGGLLSNSGENISINANDMQSEEGEKKKTGKDLMRFGSETLKKCYCHVVAPHYPLE